MKGKRKQYKMMQVKFGQVADINGKLTVTEEPRLIPNSENLFFDLVFRLQGRTYDSENDDNNKFDEFIILKASDIDTKDNENINKYKRIMNEGVWYNGFKYVRDGAIKSASMTRTQKTLLIREDLRDKIAQYTSLGKKPEKTIISKMETAKGLLLSSAVLLEDCMPRIVIIPDYEKEIKSKVRIVEEYKVDESKKTQEELQYEADKEAEEKRWAEIAAEVERCKEILTESYLRNLPKRSYLERHTYKSRNGWKTDNSRRVKPEEIANPKCFVEYNGKAYPCYHMNQTEEIKTFTIKPFSVGLEVKEYDEYPCVVNAFDGQGCADTSWMRKISEKLGLSYTTQGIQIRLPYIKGYVVSFPIRKWAADNKKYKIKDIWGKEWDLFKDKIDMILCESCFKAKLDKTKEGLQQWLFSSMKEYYECLDKYGYNKVGIAAYTKSKYQKDIYTPITYQHLYAFNFEYDDISKIVNKTGKLGAEIKNSNNVSYVKAFLNMLASQDDSEEQEDEDNLIDEEQDEDKEDEEYVNVIHKAIDLNHRMLFDPHIRNFLVNQARRIWRGLLLGRAYVKGNYIYAAGDCIAFMEHAFGCEEVKGFLQKNQLFCAGKKDEHIIIRNPLTHYSEVLKAEFIETDNTYVRHLDNVCQFPAAQDLSMARLNLDFDGDKVLVTDNSIMLAKHIPADVIYNPGDKSTSEPMDYNMTSILEYELMNLDNLTGRVTNIDTYFSNKAMERNEGLESRDFETAICKYLQGLIIDSVKSMKKVSIPGELNNAAWKKPYFLCHKYGDYKDNPKSYQSRDEAQSPFNKFVKVLEDKIKSTFKTNYGDVIDIEYLDIQDTKVLLQDNSKCDSETYFSIIKKLQPIYEEYIQRKNELNEKGKDINTLDKSDENKEKLRLLNEEYKKFYDDIKSKCRTVCSNESVLASCCVEIAYNYSKNKNDSGFKKNKDYTFPWRIAPEGILENLKVHEDRNKIDVIEVKELNHLEREFKGLLRVKDGIGLIGDTEIKTKLKDGDYQVYNILGQHFADIDVKREEEVAIAASETMIVSTDFKPLKGYTVKLIKLDGKEPEYIIEKMKSGFVLKMKENNVAVYAGNEYLASIRKEDINSLECEIRLTDYINAEFILNEVVEISESKKSLIIKMSNR